MLWQKHLLPTPNRRILLIVVVVVCVLVDTELRKGCAEVAEKKERKRKLGLNGAKSLVVVFHMSTGMRTFRALTLLSNARDELTRSNRTVGVKHNMVRSECQDKKGLERTTLIFAPKLN